jgi:hypothetical protein
MARTTLADVAAASGVSLGTASKSLNPHADRCDLSPKTRDRPAWPPTVAHRRPAVGQRRPVHPGGVYENLLTTIGGLLAEPGWHMLHTPVVDAGSWIEAQR